MDARLSGLAHRFARAGDVGRNGAGEARDGRALHALRDEGDGLEVAVRGDRKPGLDDVDAHGVEDVGDLDLFFEGHRRAGALLAVAQSGVEDQDAVLGSVVISQILDGRRSQGAQGLGSGIPTPESPGEPAQPTLRGS